MGVPGEPTGEPHLTDELLFDTAEKRYGRQRQVLRVEARRIKNLAYADKSPRDEWHRKIQFGEAESD